MAGGHHQLDGREFEQVPGVDDGQGGLVCCSSWGRRELDSTELLNNRTLDARYTGPLCTLRNFSVN